MSGVSIVILSTGDRWTELDLAIRSVRRQQIGPLEIVVIGNGTSLPDLDADLRIELPENVGIPEGRNIGFRASGHDLICFLDDDATFLCERALAGAEVALDADADLAVVGMCLVDKDLQTAHRHQPRLRSRSGDSSDVTSFPGGACVVRRRALEEVGGLAGDFFYALEETDLAWRLIDAGWKIRYDSKLLVRHERTDPRRHEGFSYQTARNRVWLVHRNLPHPLTALYLINWTVVSVIRSLRRPWDLRAHFRGLAAGFRTRPGPRRPMSWQTVWHLTRLGRPPLI